MQTKRAGPLSFYLNNGTLPIFRCDRRFFVRGPSNVRYLQRMICRVMTWAVLAAAVGAASARAQTVVINEIMYEPTSPEPEWVELYNPGAQTQDITGWKFISGIRSQVLPSIVLPSKGYAVITKDSVALRS